MHEGMLSFAILLLRLQKLARIVIVKDAQVSQGVCREKCWVDHPLAFTMGHRTCASGHHQHVLGRLMQPSGQDFSSMRRRLSRQSEQVLRGTGDCFPRPTKRFHCTNTFPWGSDNLALEKETACVRACVGWPSVRQRSKVETLLAANHR